MTRRRLAEAPRVSAVALINHAKAEDVASEPWYRITNQAGADPIVEIYGEIGWDVWADEFAADLRAIDAPQITVKISSPGGSVFEGLVIYNAILDHPATVNVVVDGMAASAASFIAQAGDHVMMNRGAQMMIHDASGLCIGNASDMEAMRLLLDKVSNEIAGVYSARAGGTVDEWRERMRAETWMTGPEAVELGLADATATTPRRGAPAEDTAESPAARLISGFRSPARDQASPADAPPEQPITGLFSIPIHPEDDPAIAITATAVEPPGDEPEPTPEAEPIEEPDPDPPTEEPEVKAPVTDDWGFVIARLTTPPSADDQWNRLKEALL